MSMDNETECNATESGSTERPDCPRRNRRKYGPGKPLESPEDEAIAQYLSAPKSIREFKSFSELAEHYNFSRMTVYRRSKDSRILKRVQHLLMNHKLAGDIVARLNWGRVVAGQVKAAAAGNTKAAQFCKELAWPEDEKPLDLFGR